MLTSNESFTEAGQEPRMQDINVTNQTKLNYEEILDYRVVLTWSTYGKKLNVVIKNKKL